MRRLVRFLGVVLVLAALGASWAGGAGAIRQVATETPAADRAGSEASGRCFVPTVSDRPPATDGTDVNRGAADPTGATPIATPEPEQAALAADIDLVVRSLAACLSRGEHQMVAELATGRYLGQLAGTGGVLPPESYVALAADLPVVPVTIRAIADVRSEGPETAGADVLYVVANQLIHGRWSFVLVETDDPADGTSGMGGARWQVDGETPLLLAAPAGAERIEVELDEYTIDLEETRIARPAEALVLAARNAGEDEHELLVLRLADGVEVEELLRQPGPRLPEGITFVGQVTLPAGSQTELILVDLTPGRYALVSLLPDANGVPDLAQGMEAELRIEG